MAADRYQQTEDLFQRAADLPPAQRGPYLDHCCNGDAALRAEVETLLSHYARADGAFLRDGALGPTGTSESADCPERIGRYLIIRKIGEGGMGVVYEAIQDNPPRTVALKLLRPGLSSRELVRRFQRETEVLGQLQHPGIAHIHDAGVVEIAGANGFTLRQPYFAMEFIRGKPLNEYARERNIDVRGRLELIARLCDAVQHAHQKGVIHRDLKPGNILVVEGDSATGTPPMPRILDFGVARVINLEPTSAAFQTDAGQLLGTIPYMSPEQFAGDDEVDTRCDIYALGVNLFELLTGRMPHDLAGKSIVEAARIVREDHPTRWRELRSSFGPDLEALTSKALAPDKDDRYASAAELAADIRHYLAGEPIAARQATVMSTLRRRVARYRGVIIASAAAVVILGALSAIALRQARENRRLAIAEHDARGRADQNAEDFARQLQISNIERGRISGGAGNLKVAEDLLWREYLQHPDSLPSFWALWELYSRQPCHLTLKGHADVVPCIAFTPDGRLMASTSWDKTIKLWDVLPGGGLRCAATINSPDYTIQELAFSPDGRTLASAGDDGPIRLIDVGSRSILRTLTGHVGIAHSVTFARDGAILASGGADRTVRLWDAASGHCAAVLKEHDAPVNRVLFSPDGRTLASAAGDASIILWDVAIADAPGAPEHVESETTSDKTIAHHRLRLRGHDGTLGQLAFTHDGRLIASAAIDRLIKVWNTSDGACVQTLAAPNGNSRLLQFSPDDRTLICAGWWSIDQWDMATAQRVRSYSLPETPNKVACTPDGRFAVAGFPAGWLRLWNLADDAALRLHGHTGRTSAIFSPDGKLIATGDEAGVLRLWDAASGQLQSTLTGHKGWIFSMRFHPRRPLLATSSSDATVRLWNIESHECIATYPGQLNLSVASIDFSPDGSLFASTRRDGGFELRDIASGDVRRVLPGDGSEPICVRFSTDGRTLATVDRANMIKLWSVSDGNLRSSLTAPRNQPWTVAFSDDGGSLASGSWQKSIQIWNPVNCQPVARLDGHNGLVRDVTFRPGEPRMLASASADGTVRLWDVPTRQCLVTLDAFGGWDADTVCFSPDGGRLLAASARGDVIVWDLHAYDRFIAGNLQYQIDRLRPDLGDAIQTQRLNSWAAGVAPHP